jgi:hypothetical protein
MARPSRRQPISWATPRRRRCRAPSRKWWVSRPGGGCSVQHLPPDCCGVQQGRHRATVRGSLPMPPRTCPQASPWYANPEISKHESASSTRSQRCKSSQYLWVLLRFAPCPRAESIAFIMVRNLCVSVLSCRLGQRQAAQTLAPGRKNGVGKGRCHQGDRRFAHTPRLLCAWHDDGVHQRRFVVAQQRVIVEV